MASLHQLHNHPVTEEREGIASDKVLVDKCFAGLFENIEPYWDDNHVIVSKETYLAIKKVEKHYDKNEDKIKDDIFSIFEKRFCGII